MGNAKERKDEIILSALLTTPTVKEASKKSGISESIIYSRLKEPGFKSRYDSARLDVLEENKTALQHHIGKAVECISEIIDDKTATPQTRLNASESIIRNSLKMTEQVDILKRLDSLEKLVLKK